MTTPDCTTTPVKRCTKCAEEKSATTDYWHKDAHGLYGFKAICKVCKKEKDAADWLDSEKSAKKKANGKAWNKRNRAYHTRKEREWRRNNPERARQRENKTRKERQKRYRLKHPETNSLIRARRRNAPGTHTKEDIELQYRSQQGRCWWCQRALNGVYDVDHVRPLTRNGTNYPNNLVVACEFCNASKGNKLPWQWIGRLL